MKDRLIDIFVFVGLGLSIGVAWYWGYIKPADEFRKAVASCMIDKNDMSMASYEDCTNETRSLIKTGQENAR